MPELEQVLHIYVEDMNGTQIHGSVVKTYLLPSNDIVSIANTAKGPVTVHLNIRSDLRVEVEYQGQKVEEKVASSADSVHIQFPIRLVTAHERWAYLGIGVLFILLIVVLASVFPQVVGFTQLVYRAVLAVGVGLIFAGVTGFLKVDLKLSEGNAVTAGGSAAAFILLYLVNPPGV